MVLESVPLSLRGELTRWLLEVRTGVFVGNVSAMVRDKLWEMVCRRLHKKGGGFLIQSTNNEQGYTIRSVGVTTKTVEDHGGLLLMCSKPAAISEPTQASTKI